MVSTSDVEKVLKIITPYKDVMKRWYEDHPFDQWLPKRTDFTGRKMEVPIGIDVPPGNSHTFEDAMAAEADGNEYAQFVITRVRDYGLLYIDNEAIEASKGADAAWVETLRDQIKGIDTRVKMTRAYELWGNGSGMIGKIAAGGIAGNVITLDDPETVIRFSKKQRLDVAAAEVTGAIKGGTPGYLEVSAIDEDTGKITVTNIGDVTGVATGDFLFPRGNRNKALTGVGAYVPTAAHLAANPSLWGENRSDNPTKKAGIRFNGSSFGLAEAFERGLARAARSGVFVDAIWTNYKYFTNLSLDLGAKAKREFVRIGNFGFDAIHVFSNGRKVPVMADQNVPDAEAFGLTRKTWVWHTLGETIRWLTDGATTIVKPTADGVQARRGWRGQLICRSPGDNIRWTLPT